MSLSIIPPVLNDPIEIQITIASIRETAAAWFTCSMLERHRNK